jgi:hypothetical protein
MPALDVNAFPSLQWVRINWKSFPRAFKQPFYDGLQFVADRNPEKVIILETGVGLCRCHSPRLKEGWLSAERDYREISNLYSSEMNNISIKR